MTACLHVVGISGTRQPAIAVTIATIIKKTVIMFHVKHFLEGMEK